MEFIGLHALAAEAQDDFSLVHAGTVLLQQAQLYKARHLKGYGGDVGVSGLGYELQVALGIVANQVYDGHLVHAKHLIGTVAAEVLAVLIHLTVIFHDQ